MIYVSKLFIYPIKSCAPIAVEHAELMRRGLAGDRLLMITTPGGQFVTQRVEPRLALIQPQLDGRQLTLSAPGMQPITLSIENSGNATDVVVWHDRCAAVDQGSAVAAWLSTFIGRDLRLMAMQEEFERAAGDGSSIVSFADGYPLLLLSQAALELLNQKLSRPIDALRFRPNIVVSGCEPHAEDQWSEFRIADIKLRNAGRCARCVVPTIDQKTAVKGVEPNRTLAAYRVLDGAISFGINVVPQTLGAIQVGDRVTVASTVAAGELVL